MILYLLPFKTGTEFKFGITKRDRVYDLDKLFGVDLERAKIVRAKNNKTIHSIEHQIKCEYYDVRSTKYEGVTGWTEILPMEYWDEVLSDIQIKKQKERLGIQIQDGIAPRVKIIKPVNEVVSVEYRFCEEGLTPEGIFYLNHPYGKMLIEAIKCGKKELEFSEKDFPCIHDFAERIRYKIVFYTYIEQLSTKVRGKSVTRDKLEFLGKPITIQFDFQCVKFSFSKYLIQDVFNGQLDYFMNAVRPAVIDNIFYHELVQSESEARAWLQYLTTSEEEFKRLCRLRGYLPDIPPPEPYNVTRKPIDLRKDIANEKDWKLLWYESRQNEKCSFEDFLERGGYTKEDDQWIKFY